MSSIASWIEQHGLGKYTDLFVENEIDFDVLDQITLEELEVLGIPLGARMRGKIIIGLCRTRRW
jgi:hypothetical protein